MESLRLELFVEDIEGSAEFYSRVLGFTRESESAGYVSLRRGSAVLGIGLMEKLPERHPVKGAADERPGLGVEVVIEVDDVDAAYARVQTSNHPVISALKERPWGLRDFRVVDPEGYYIRVTSH